MIKKVQMKFVAVMMIILSFIMIFVSGAVLLNLTINENKEIKVSLNLIIRNYRNELSPFDDKTPEENLNNLRSFAIELDNNYNIIYMKYEENTFTKESIITLTNKIINRKDNEGKIDNIAYLKTTNENGMVIAAIDRTIENSVFYQTIISIIIFTIVGLLTLLSIIILLSFWIVKPIKETLDKQKRFISDSSHELKTPLSIINANVDALSNEIGNNDWINNIKSQTSRMNTLIIDMLQLAKLEETKTIINNQIDLSHIIENTILPFEALAFESNKKLTINIEKNISYIGNEENIKNITNIFMDNAIKYSNEKGKIKVTLKKEKNTPFLEIYNTGCTFLNEERDKIFQRFYRNDNSRNRETGGSGLGLSIAKTIADKNNWKIEVDSEYNKYTKFTIYFE